ncbi:MAG TPA: N-methyl-L-tryptophan oxidase [Steroidobacteraceae bacterium]|jgi:sarcosine oxidase|nr:N-methyl-L-tryptophan oxidase [Steroidobacteraceae bacterium]
MRNYDVVVVGLGAMGSATLYALAQRGRKVIGIERFEPGHHLGSSYGESRIIRMAYYEDPAYVPLLRLAFDAWRRLERRTGERILTITGILEAGVAGSVLVEGSLRSAREHDIPHEVLHPRQVNQRFPAFSIPPDWHCVFQPDAGILQPEKAIDLFVKSAAELGATVATGTKVERVLAAGDRVEVRLESGETIEAGSAVLAAGPWIAELVPELGSKLRLTRQPLMWFEPQEPQLVRPQSMPVFFFDTSEDLVYGFPDFRGSGVKAASHAACGELKSADEIRAEASDEERAHLGRMMARLVPAAAGRVRQSQVCIYTRSPDEHFVLGLHPSAPKIVLASPCSGHGFKFAGIFGEILADLATTKATDKPIDFFRPSRLM